MKTNKRMSLWPFDNSIMVEDGDKTRHYKKITPSSYDRISRLSHRTQFNHHKVSISTYDDGISFVAIDRR